MHKKKLTLVSIIKLRRINIDASLINLLSCHTFVFNLQLLCIFPFKFTKLYLILNGKEEAKKRLKQKNTNESYNVKPVAAKD